MPAVVVDRLRLALGVAVVVGAAPVARPLHVRAQLAVAAVDRRALGRLHRAARERAHRDGRPGRPRRGDADVVQRPPRHRGQDADRGELRVAPLRGAHRHGRVALGQLDGVVALGHGVGDVLRRDVLVEVDERLPAAAAVARVGGRSRDRGLRRQRVEALALVRQRALGVRAAQAERHGGVEARGGPGAGGRVGLLVPGDGAGGVDDPVAELGQEPARGRVVARPGAGLQQQRRRGRGAAGHGQEVAGDLLEGARGLARRVDAREDGAGDAVAPERAHDRHPRQQPDAGGLHGGAELAVGRVRSQVGDRGDLHTRLAQRERGIEAAVAGRGDDRGRARAYGPELRQAARAAGHHHAGEVVVLEDERLLDRARGRDVALCAHLVQRVALPDRDEPVVEAERGRVRQHLDAGGAGLVGQRTDALVAALGEQRAARLDVVVGEHDVGALAGRGDRGRQPGDPASDHEHVAVAAPVLRAPEAVVLALGEAPEAGDAAQRALVQRPGAAGPLEGLVVEAGRGEGAARDVRHAA